MSEINPRTGIIHYMEKLHRQSWSYLGHWSCETPRLPIVPLSPLYSQVHKFGLLFELQSTMELKIIYIYNIWQITSSRAMSLSFIQLSSGGLRGFCSRSKLWQLGKTGMQQHTHQTQIPCSLSGIQTWLKWTQVPDTPQIPVTWFSIVCNCFESESASIHFFEFLCSLDFPCFDLDLACSGLYLFAPVFSYCDFCYTFWNCLPCA